MMLARMFLAVFLAVVLSHPASAGRSAFTWPWSKAMKEPSLGPQIVPFRSGDPGLRRFGAAMFPTRPS